MITIKVRYCLNFFTTQTEHAGFIAKAQFIFLLKCYACISRSFHSADTVFGEKVLLQCGWRPKPEKQCGRFRSSVGLWLQTDLFIQWILHWIGKEVNKRVVIICRIPSRSIINHCVVFCHLEKSSKPIALWGFATWGNTARQHSSWFESLLTLACSFFYQLILSYLLCIAISPLTTHLITALLLLMCAEKSIGST